MVKKSKPSKGKHLAAAPPPGVKVVRDAKTGQSVTVRGFGALKGDGLKIEKGVSLLKPIAEQALAKRPVKRGNDMSRAERRKAG